MECCIFFSWGVWPLALFHILSPLIKCHTLLFPSCTSSFPATFIFPSLRKVAFLVFRAISAGHLFWEMCHVHERSERKKGSRKKYEKALETRKLASGETQEEKPLTVLISSCVFKAAKTIICWENTIAEISKLVVKLRKGREIKCTWSGATPMFKKWKKGKFRATLNSKLAPRE